MNELISLLHYENNVPYEISALDEAFFTVVKKVDFVHIKTLLLK